MVTARRVRDPSGRGGRPICVPCCIARPKPRTRLGGDSCGVLETWAETASRSDRHCRKLFLMQRSRATACQMSQEATRFADEIGLAWAKWTREHRRVPDSLERRGCDVIVAWPESALGSASCNVIRVGCVNVTLEVWTSSLKPPLLTSN